jgi:hypothetical protein
MEDKIMFLKLKSLLLVTLVATSVTGQGVFKSKNVVTRVSPDRLDGVSYALPRTIIHASLPFKRSDARPGEYEKYAPCFFPKDIAAGRIVVSETSFTLEAPTFTFTGEPDPDQHFVAKIKGGFFEDKTMSLEFNEDGVITKGEATSTNVALDVAIGAARAIISSVAAVRLPTVERKKVAPDSTEGQDAQRETFERLYELDICRARIVADAASTVVALAKEVAKLSGDSNAIQQAGNAQNQVDQAYVEIAAATEAEAEPSQVDRQLEDWAAAREELRVAQEEFRVAEKKVSANRRRSVRRALEQRVDQARQEVALARQRIDRASNPINGFFERVVEHATNARNYSNQVARYAQTTRADEAQAVRDALSKIDSAIIFARNAQPSVVRAFANEYDKAKKIFDRIQALKKRREDLASGASTPETVSADALKLLINGTDEMIAAYEQSYFLGTEATESWTSNFRFRPLNFNFTTSANEFQNSRVFMILTDEGLCPTDETTEQGVKIKGTFRNPKCPNATNPTMPSGAKAIWLSVDRLREGRNFWNDIHRANVEEERRGRRGFYYRIPAAALVKLKVGSLGSDQIAQLFEQGRAHVLPSGDEKGRDTMKVAQLGPTVSLPASAAGRTTQYTLEFHEATGALKNFKLGSNSLLQKTLVDEASGAASDIIATKQAREKARADATDELNLLKRELEILQTQNAINEEKKKLATGQPSPSP